MLLLLAGTGCSSGTGAIFETMGNVVQRSGAAEHARLDPNFRYLRVTIEGRVALLALGNVEPASPTPVEVWYSAEREVLRFQSGRLVGATGLTTEWRNVKLPEFPAWSVLARYGEPQHWLRTRDVMPGYRFGVLDSLILRPIEPPGRSSIEGLPPRQLAWFEETSEREVRTSGGRPLLERDRVKNLPPARYAVDLRGGREEVVYGEQCVAADLCFTWQRWPPEGVSR
jgi:hypothetical protein